MKLIFPRIEYKEKAIDYINEFYEYGSEINGSGGLDYFLKESTYEKWLENVLKDIDIANIPDSDVPKITYFCVREEDDRIIGMVNLRLALTDFWEKRQVISAIRSDQPSAANITPRKFLIGRSRFTIRWV